MIFFLLLGAMLAVPIFGLVIFAKAEQAANDCSLILWCDTQ